MTARGGVPADGSVGDVTVTVDWKQPPASVEWFPPDDAALAVRRRTSETEGARTRLTFRAQRVPGEEVEASTLESVVAWTDASGARHGLRVPIELEGKGDVDDPRTTWLTAAAAVVGGGELGVGGRDGRAAAPGILAKDQDGQEVDLGKLRGKVVVLEWTNPDCPFVQRHYERRRCPRWRIASGARRWCGSP